MQLLIDQLVQQGVVDFFISPGSRNTPLILAASKNPNAIMHRHFDERGLGFFALGHALATKRPAVIIVTSGTAAGNLVPAVMEASHSSVPLILLTADRPPELRDCGANQTSNQVNMFSNFVRFQFEFDPEMPPKAVASKIAQAVCNSLWPHPGPVHLNCPIREPFYPIAPAETVAAPSLHFASRTASTSLRLPARGVILLGRVPNRGDLIAALNIAKQLQWPVFADLLSEARLFPTKEQIKYFDRMELHADCILHIGERLTSKKIETFRANRYIHVSPYPHWIDPFHAVTDRICGSASSLEVEAPIDPEWFSSWKQKDREIEPIAQQALSESLHTESALIANLAKLPLDHHAVFFANSMPIREAHWFFHPAKCKAFFANRGLSGIDGNIATIAGIAEHMPVLAILGDLTTLHDLNSLSLLSSSKHPVTLIISNNGGGGIFNHFPASEDPAAAPFIIYEHSLQFEQAARMFHIPYSKSTNITLGQTQIIEWSTDRQENYLFHKTKIKTLFIQK